MTTSDLAYNHALHAYMVLMAGPMLDREGVDQYGDVDTPKVQVLGWIRDAFQVGQQASQTALRYRIQPSTGVRLVDGEPVEFTEYDIATAAAVVSSHGEDKAAAEAEFERLNKLDPCEFCEPFDRLMNGG